MSSKALRNRFLREKVVLVSQLWNRFVPTAWEGSAETGKLEHPVPRSGAEFASGGPVADLVSQFWVPFRGFIFRPELQFGLSN
jgi:hypothetical protein